MFDVFVSCLVLVVRCLLFVVGCLLLVVCRPCCNLSYVCLLFAVDC